MGYAELLAWNHEKHYTETDDEFDALLDSLVMFR